MPALQQKSTAMLSKLCQPVQLCCLAQVLLRQCYASTGLSSPAAPKAHVHLAHPARQLTRFRFAAQTKTCNFASCFAPRGNMSAGLDAIEDLETVPPPQHHRIDASPSRTMQEGFASLMGIWLRRPEHNDRLARMSRMAHLANFLLDILCILGFSARHDVQYRTHAYVDILDIWLRRPEHNDRLARMSRMAHLANFLLDILCILGVRDMTFSIARMHTLTTFFIDYLSIDPQINVDGMLEKR